MSAKTSTWVCLSDPFAGCSDADESFARNQILAARGYPPAVVRFLRIILGTGLIWKLLLDWDSCDEEVPVFDLFFGWGINLFLLLLFLLPFIMIPLLFLIYSICTIFEFIKNLKTIRDEKR